MIFGWEPAWLPGDYTYVCLMTGHNNTMIGKLRSLR